MKNKLRNALNSILSFRDDELDLPKANFISKWGMLSIDVILLICASLFTISFLQDLDINTPFGTNIILNMLLAVSTNFVFMVIFKTYSGPIGYSFLTDVGRILLSSISTFILLILLNYVYAISLGEKLFLNASLVLYLFFSYTFLFSFRLVVKHISEYFRFKRKASLSKQVQNLQIEDILEREPIEFGGEEKESQIKGKTILVTGGAGSIGSEIVRLLIQFKPKAILVLDQAETPLYNLKIELESNFPDLNVKYIICDVSNRNRLITFFKAYKIDIIYHAAAYKHVPLMEENSAEAILTNIYGTKNLADLAIQYNVSRFVFISTDKAINPSNVMGASKRAAEMYVQSLDYNINKLKSTTSTKFIITRFGNVLDSNGSVVPLFKKQIEDGGPVTVSHPDIIRYFMTITEACQLVLEAGTMGHGGEIYIFDMGSPIKIMNLAIKMIKLAGLVPNKDIDIKITGLRPGEKLYEELISDSSEVIPTYHKKIFINKVDIESFSLVNDKVNDLINAATSLKDTEVVTMLKDLVPEFISKNSEFECLDKTRLSSFTRTKENLKIIHTKP